MIYTAEDIIVHQDKENPEWIFGTDASEDGRYLYLYQYKDTSKARHIYIYTVTGHSRNRSYYQKNLVWLAEPDEDGIKPGIQWRKVINEYVADYSV